MPTLLGPAAQRAVPLLVLGFASRHGIPRQGHYHNVLLQQQDAQASEAVVAPAGELAPLPPLASVVAVVLRELSQRFPERLRRLPLLLHAQRLWLRLR